MEEGANPEEFFEGLVGLCGAIHNVALRGGQKEVLGCRAFPHNEGAGLPACRQGLHAAQLLLQGEDGIV